MKESGISNETQSQQPEAVSVWVKVKETVGKINHVIDVIGKCLFRLRKLVLAAPVAYYAFLLANYNSAHLPEQVGLAMQSNGEFLYTIGRGMAVTGPFALTVGCLVLMFFSRKAMYSWAISVFTLALPVLLLISNLYPA